MKKIVSVLLLVCMTLALVVTTNAESPIELHFITRRRGNAYEENTVKSIIEERFNVKIRWEILPSEGYNDACSVILTSGDYPDMMEYAASSDFYLKEVPLLAEDGVLAPLNELLEKHGQNILADRPEDEKWLWVDGERYSIPCRPGDVTESFVTIRKDWLDALGLEVPTTLDEFTKVCQAFTFDDPDGNGVQDTYALGGALNGHPIDTLTVVMGFFGVVKDWMMQDDQYIPYQLTDNMKAALLYLRELYQLGVVDPEFAVDTRDKYLEKKSLNRFGIEQWYLTQTGSTSAWWNTFIANVPQQVTIPLPLIEVEGYETVWPNPIASRYGVALGGFQLLIFNKNKHKEKTMEIINFLASDEGSELVTFGPKGVTWDEDENGNYIDIAVDEETAKQSGKELYCVVFWHNIFKRNADPLVLEGLKVYTPFVRAARDFPYVYEGDTSALGSLLDTHMIKIITEADIDPDEAFAAMVDEYKQMGGAACIEWYNEMMSKQ